MNDKESPRILLVEDDDMLSDLLKKGLETRNYFIYRAANTEEAKKILEENKIDLMLLDIILPGTDGVTFLEKLKSDVKFEDLTVIMISNLSQEEDVERAKRAGAVDYLVKANVLPTDILNKVETYLKMKL